MSAEWLTQYPIWGTLYPMDRATQIEALYRRDAARLQRAVARRARADQTVIEDACAYAWVELLTNENVDVTADAIFGWLLLVATREAWRLANRDARASVRLDDPESGADPASSLDVEAQVQAREDLRLLDQLTPKQAEMMRLHAAGLDYNEIAERLGVTYTNVNKHLTKARKKLRDLRGGAN